MSRIDELIAEYCSAGVVHKTIGEVAEYSRTRVDAVDLDETNFVGVDNLAADKGGRVDATYLPNTDRLTAYGPGDVLLGNIRPYLKKVWLATNSGGCSGDVLTLRINPAHKELLDSEFLYYLLSSDGFFVYSMQHAKGAKMPRGSKTAILSYRIPVPPLEVQREIVRILDTFSKMQAELQAELEARKLQYEHYRSQLFLTSGNATFWPLGQLCETISAGGDRPKNFVKGQLVSTEEMPYPIFSNGTGESAVYGFTDSFRITKAAVTVSARGTIGAHAIRDAYFTPIVRLIVLIPNTERVNIRYLNYALDVTEIGHSGGSIPQLTVPNVKKIEIPVPPMVEQVRIADVLDKFDALVSDLSVGLPAELAARRLQYEYYRDKLLTFKELETAL